MKFKFKVQQYQTDAAEAVTAVFAGQPNQGAAAYLRDLGRTATFRGMEVMPGFQAQTEMAEGYANAPVALSRDALLANVRAVQRRNQLPESVTLFAGMGACQLDVEMETGTGKTYVYTKTMLELNRRYGWCKFIVVVPSVAIREGVAKNLENTRDHFFEQYQKSIRFFIYNSDNLTELDAYSQSDDDDKPTDEFRRAVGEGTFTEEFMAKLPEDIADAPHAHAVEALVRSVYDAHALDGMIGRAEEKVTENALTENFARREFKELWGRINHKHAYTVSFSDDELREKAIARINADLRVNKLQYTLTTGGQKGEAKREELARGDSFARGGTETHDVETGTVAVAVSYDLVGEVARGAAITRRSAAAILSGIDANVFGLYRVNPEEFIKKAAALIVSEKATMVVEHISYHEIDDVYDEAIFTERMPDNASRAYEAKKGIQRFVFPDSDGERRFAEDMDAAAEVAVYAKLPRTFQIPTPVGNYAPDWAIAFKEGSVRHVFFVAETKGTMDTMELSGVENAKIACAKKLFNEMSTSDVRYHNVATYDDLLEVMGRLP